MNVRLVALCVLAAAALSMPAYATAGEKMGCGTLANAFGPFDYTNPEDRAKHLAIVERHHFTESVRTLEHGHTSTIPADLDYTLRAFPNHHQALYAMARWQLMHGDKAGPHNLTAECYFQRAIEFKPDDGVVWMIYGIFLQRKGDLKGALARYLRAQELMPHSPELSYNLGLLYLQMKNYKKAREYAKKAYGGGYPLPGLRDKLKEVGQWR